MCFTPNVHPMAYVFLWFTGAKQCECFHVRDVTRDDLRGREREKEAPTLTVDIVIK